MPVLSGLPEGVEAVRRKNKGTEYLMVMNHNEADAELTLDGEFTDLISGEKVRSGSKIPSFGVYVLVS